MLFPYGTDAPIYHRPIATISIITINVLMFFATGMGVDVFVPRTGPYDWLHLHFDQINPLQWLTAAFMHAGVIHLVGNMIFLWVFGLIVEGKIGWMKFSGLYLGICLLKGALTQIPMFLFFDSSGQAFGASGAIFGIMAVALLWAPRNEVSCLFAFTWFWIRSFEVSVVAFCGFFVAFQVLFLSLGRWMGGGWMSSELLHLIGFAAGLPWAWWMLRTGRVDCEGWDLISKLQGRSPPVRHLSASEESAAGRAALEEILASPSQFRPRASDNWEQQTSPLPQAPSKPIRKVPSPPPGSDLDW